jgi:hypothetical protein
MAALMVLKGLARSPFAPVSLPLLAETNTHLAATPSVPSQFSSWYLSSKGSFGFDGVHDEPLEDPPGVWDGFQGLRVLPGWRKANSVVTVLA